MILLILGAIAIILWYAFGGLRSPLGKVALVFAIGALLVLGGLSAYVLSKEKHSTPVATMTCASDEHPIYGSDGKVTWCSPNSYPNAQEVPTN